MPSDLSMSAIFHKIAHCERLNRAEAAFVSRRHESLKQSYLAALNQCDEEERRAIAVSEAQCEVEARRMDREYRLALRLEEKLNKPGAGSDLKAHKATKGESAGLAYKVCLSCYYDTQLENMLATQELPLSSEFLSALSELEAALVHLNDVTKTSRSRGARIWAN